MIDFFKSHKEELRLAKFEIFELEAKLKNIKRTVIDMSIGDPEPSEVVARREYVARVAAFHKDVLDKKIKAMISEVRAELEKIENTPKMDEILKGTCNALWLIYDWGEQCVNEMISVQVDGLSEDEKKLLDDKLK